MSIFDTYGAPTFGLDDCKIALFISNNNYSAPLDVPSVQMLEPSLETINAILDGDDKQTAVAARIIGGQLTLRFGSIDLDVISMITGDTISPYGTTPNRQRHIPITNRNPPYVGLVGRALAAEGTGDLHIFVPKMKVFDGFSLSLEYGSFSIPEITFRIVADDFGRIIVPFEHETITPIAIPPVIP